MGKPDKIISYQDLLFILETLDNSRLAARDIIQPALREDLDRCIKILEDCKNA